MHSLANTTPDALIGADGLPRFGRFDGTVARINGRDTALRTTLGGRASAFARHFHYKQFQYFGIISNDLLIGCALADTAWMGLAFVYVFDTRSGELEEYTWRSPLSRALQMSSSPTDGESRFRQTGIDIRMGYQRIEGGLRKTLSLTCDALQINASMDESADYEAMSLCTRTGVNGWTYANKVAGVAVNGRLQWRQQEIELGALNACGHHDFSAGYMRRETFWNWACLSTEVDGIALGLNLSCGVNETSASENCIWVDGKLHSMGGIFFEYDADDLMQPWKIFSADGKLALRFVPLGRHVEKLNLGVFASNFNQLFGQFSGSIHVDDNRHLVLNQHYGFVEEQFAKW